MNRIYYPTNYRTTRQVLFALGALLVGVVFTLAMYGKIYFATLGIFFLGSQLIAWSTAPGYQFGDTSFNIVRWIHTSAFPYEWFASSVRDTFVHKSGVLLWYQRPNQEKKDLFIPAKDPQRMKVLFLRGCKIRHKDLEKAAWVSSPDRTPSELLESAGLYFQEVLENPVLPLFALEDPNLYQRIYLAAQDAKLMDWFTYAPETHQRVFICKSLRWLTGESKLKLSETLQRILDVHDQFAHGKCSQQKLEATLTELERPKKRSKPTPLNTKINGMLAAIWLHRRTMFTEPERALEHFLKQWQKNDPAVYSAFIQTFPGV